MIDAAAASTWRIVPLNYRIRAHGTALSTLLDAYALDPAMGRAQFLQEWLTDEC